MERKLEIYGFVVKGKHHLMYGYNLSKFCLRGNTECVYIDGTKTHVINGYNPLTAARKIVMEVIGYNAEDIEDFYVIPLFDKGA